MAQVVVVMSHSTSTSAAAECLENIYFENLKILLQKNSMGDVRIVSFLSDFRSPRLLVHLLGDTLRRPFELC